MSKFNNAFKNYISTIARINSDAGKVRVIVKEKCKEEELTELETAAAMEFLNTVKNGIVEINEVAESIGESGDADGIMEFARRRQRFLLSIPVGLAFVGLCALILGYMGGKSDRIYLMFWVPVAFLQAKIFRAIGRGLGFHFKIASSAITVFGYFLFMYLAIYFFVNTHANQPISGDDHFSIFIGSLALFVDLFAISTLVFSVIWVFKFSTIRIGSDYIEWAKAQDEYRNPKYISNNGVRVSDNPYA